MPDVLSVLRRDHANMSKLLDVLDQQLAIFDAAGSPDYDVVQGIVEYSAEYPGLYHHPVEDAVYRKLQERNPAAAQEIGDQMAEHEILASLVQKLSDAVGKILLEAEIPRDSFDRVAREFLVFYRHHIAQEEAVFFPAAEEHLAPEDWEEIAALILEAKDPLFTTTAEERFEALRHRVLEWNSEVGS
ncbi:MAG: hemerythrin domain-containing protein [Kiloniellales bacterium]|nr:hemerythrin domain-containing protein [Kiloniellales bacterium]